jgi:Protein kinase domain/MshEN domain
MSDAIDSGHFLASRFELVRRIGRGAVGDVWLAKDMKLNGEQVACKVLNAAFAGDRRAIADLKREVLFARKLRHPDIVAVYTFWDAAEAHFITMEYVEGSNLAEVLTKRDRPFRLDEVMSWMKQASDALHFAHEHQVLHRDVKPANFLLAQNGDCRLADFGVAQTAWEAQTRMTGRTTSGTLMFMSPEQLRGDPLDYRSDLYGLAASLYELLSGAPPFYGRSLIHQIQFDDPEPLTHLPETANDVLMKGLAKKREDRQDSCSAFYHELESAVVQSADAEPPPLRTYELPVDPDGDTVTMPAAEEPREKMRLGSLLVEAGAITKAQLRDALKEQREHGATLGSIIVREGFADETSIVQALAQQLRIPVIAPSEESFDAEVVALLDRDPALAHKCIPVRREEGQVLVLTADPLDMTAINQIEATTGQVALRLATESEVLAAIRRAHEED